VRRPGGGRCRTGLRGEGARGGGAGREGGVVVGVARKHTELEGVGAGTLKHEQRLHADVERGEVGHGRPHAQFVRASDAAADLAELPSGVDGLVLGVYEAEAEGLDWELLHAQAEETWGGGHIVAEVGSVGHGDGGGVVEAQLDEGGGGGGGGNGEEEAGERGAAQADDEGGRRRRLCMVDA
jgi:hypothetical protein